MTTLWHYTCDHGAELIRRDGLVKAHPQPVLDQVTLSWWTDLGPEHRYEVGLTSDLLTCDRMAHRFQAKDPSTLERWTRAARNWRIPPVVRDELEDGRLPAHWWVAFDPVEVVT